MRLGKIYTEGKHALAEAMTHAPHAVLKVFKDAKDEDIAQISLFKLMVPYEKFVQDLQPSSATSLVLLAGLEDPHNVGAIIRSAAGFGASGVLIPEKGQSPVTSTVLKVSAGMAFRVPLVTLSSIEQAVSDLKKRGFKIYGLAGEAGESIADAEFSEPAVFLLGNEGTGLPKHLRALCDKELRIPMHPRTESLNVAAAAAATLFAWSSKHPEALAN